MALSLPGSGRVLAEVAKGYSPVVRLLKVATETGAIFSIFPKKKALRRESESDKDYRFIEAKICDFLMICKGIRVNAQLFWVTPDYFH